MQPIYQNPNVPTTDSIYRTNVIVWAAMLIAQFMFLIVLYFAKNELFHNSGQTAASASSSANVPVLILAAAGLGAFVLSFVIKARLIKFAIQDLNVNLVQTAQIVAYALCEAISLVGLIAAFVFDSHYFWVWFVFGVLGLLLHFPRRENFRAAAFKGIH